MNARAYCCVGLILFASACVGVDDAGQGDDDDDAGPPPGPACVDAPGTAGAVDVLFVIDNSGSFSAEQQRVIAALGAFVEPLVASGLDYHVGVIRSDLAEGGVLHNYAGPDVDGCVVCTVLTPAVACDAAPNVDGLDPDERDALLVDACPAWAVLASMFAGTEGSAFEASFDAASRALGAEGDVPVDNAGFRREGAPLHIVFVSDEDEGAKRDGTDVHFYERLFEPVAGIGNEQLVTTSAIVGINEDLAPDVVADLCPILASTFNDDILDDDARAVGLIETLREFENGCAGPDDDGGFAETGGRFIELACRTGGVIGNLCDDDLAIPFADAAALVLDRCVDGACISNASCDGGAICNASTQQCIDVAGCLIDAHCAFGTFCDDGVCEPGCRRGGDCPRDAECDGARCVDVCTDNSECAFGFRCNGACELDTRGPFCEQCDGGIASGDCGGPGNYCLVDTAGNEFCGVDCYAGEECPSGYGCLDVIIVPPAAPFCDLPEFCDAGLCSRTAGACIVDEGCPEGPPQGSCVAETGGRAGSCALAPETVCASDADCLTPGDACILVQCRASGGAFGTCSCTRDSDCPVDQCIGADISDPTRPIRGNCELSGHPCFENFECDVITCIEGGCLIGANCVPANDVTCVDVLTP